MKDIAEAIGVNVATVSRALSGRAGVSPDVRNRIEAQAAAMKYRPNIHARSLATNRTETIGLICDLPTEMLFANPFWGCVLAGIEAEARRDGGLKQQIEELQAKIAGGYEFIDLIKEQLK